jgi:hypothetical protein
MLYTKDTLHKKLDETSLFNPVEIRDIMNAVGKYSMGCCVIACELLGIVLTGEDVDTMFNTEVVETKSYIEVHETKTGGSDKC